VALPGIFQKHGPRVGTEISTEKSPPTAVGLPATVSTVCAISYVCPFSLFSSAFELAVMFLLWLPQISLRTQPVHWLHRGLQKRARLHYCMAYGCQRKQLSLLQVYKGPNGCIARNVLSSTHSGYLSALIGYSYPSATHCRPICSDFLAVMRFRGVSVGMTLSGQCKGSLTR
jgi:hypothetical protein